MCRGVLGVEEEFSLKIIELDIKQGEHCDMQIISQESCF